MVVASRAGAQARSGEFFLLSLQALDGNPAVSQLLLGPRDAEARRSGGGARGSAPVTTVQREVFGESLSDPNSSLGTKQVLEQMTVGARREFEGRRPADPSGYDPNKYGNEEPQQWYAM